MAVNNTTILDKIWLNGTSDYQARIPQATQAGVSAVIEALDKPFNRHLKNEFVFALFNVVAMTMIHQLNFKNPLAQFMKGTINHGTHIQEIMNKLIKAKTYRMDADTLFKVSRPEAKAFYHTLNRQDRYDITINEVELRKAFDTEFGLNEYVSSVMNLPMVSDEYDTYRIMLQLMAEYHSKHGFFKVKCADLSDLESGEREAKAFVREVKKYTGKLRFPEPKYNAASMPVACQPEDMVLFTTPDVMALIDVELLASAFHCNKVELDSKVVIVDELPIPGAQALLAAKDWFVCADYVYETTQFYNPETLNTNYYLHHWGIYSCSPFMPAILFTTDDTSTIPVVTVEPTELKMSVLSDGVQTTSLVSGKEYDIVTNLNGTVTPEHEGVEVVPDSVIFELNAHKADGTGIQINPAKVYIDRVGVLHLGGYWPADSVLTIKAKSTYINPNGDTDIYEAEVELTVNASAAEE